MESLLVFITSFTIGFLIFKAPNFTFFMVIYIQIYYVKRRFHFGKVGGNVACFPSHSSFQSMGTPPPHPFVFFISLVSLLWSTKGQNLKTYDLSSCTFYFSHVIPSPSVSKNAYNSFYKSSPLRTLETIAI